MTRFHRRMFGVILLLLAIFILANIFVIDVFHAVSISATAHFSSRAVPKHLTCKISDKTQSPVYEITTRDTDVTPGERGFAPIMTSADRAVMQRLLRTFVDTLDAANITYFMYGGTLLGSYRHHGAIPWDDDVDLMVDAAKMPRMKRALASLGSAFHLSTKSMYRWKFYGNESTPIKNIEWRYPFLDISFYRQNAHGVFDYDPGYAKRFRYSKYVVFPLCKRPFWGLMLNAPRDTLGFLKQNYDLDLCISNAYNHKIEQGIAAKKIVKAKCDKLWSRFPFVFRTKSFKGTNETLKVGSTVISSMFCDVVLGRRKITLCNAPQIQVYSAQSCL
ncbi:hypothetical protein LSAT2_005438 [Lamellibrachia satsuma]|nr:hypothetical protein LSAT2_005438 [Lamellibrachia satsuma]